MNTNSRENASRTDERIDKLADQILTLVDVFAKKVITPAPVKEVEESCVTCGGPHAHYNCDATNSNQPSVCAVTGTYNQVAPQNRANNYMAPPGFAPVQNNQNRAIAWKITDIKGIDSRFCIHKILMEEDYKPAVQSQRRVNSKIHEVIKKEVIKLLDAGMIYPISVNP
nr:reverse transcriptase domain-containing protein [Tanacetum cinerariifolium]